MNMNKLPKAYTNDELGHIIRDAFLQGVNYGLNAEEYFSPAIGSVDCVEIYPETLYDVWRHTREAKQLLNYKK